MINLCFEPVTGMITGGLMDSRELVNRTIRFQHPERLPHDFPEPYDSDFYWTGMSPSPDDRPSKGGYDEWGAYWEHLRVQQPGRGEGIPAEEIGRISIA